MKKKNMNNLNVLPLPESIQIYKNITPETINVPVLFKKSETSEKEIDNFFQIISCSGVLEDSVVKDFWIDVGRAISVGEKRKTEKVQAVGGIFSSLFNAKVVGDDIIYNGEKSKIEILIAPTSMLNGDQKILFDVPSVFFDGTYYTVRGKFSVQLKKKLCDISV